LRVRIIGAVCTLSLLLSLSVVAGAVADTPSSPSPTASPSATASPASGQDAGTDVDARAKEWLHRLQTGDIDRSQLDEAMNAALTPAVIKGLSAKFAPLGDPQSFTPLGQQIVPGDRMAYVYTVVFKTTTLNEVFVLDKDGKIAGIQFPPAQQ
jgi:hypothetical protein